MNGIIIVNKPAGWTSFDVVAKIRNLTGTVKVGHSGTLDPIATGVLPVFLGMATKMIKYFLNGDKGYEAEMVLGARTDSGDATGKFQNSNLQLPNSKQMPITITKEQIESAMNKYRGEIMQTPPMFSAVKIKGQRLYELARKGIEVKREARKITIYALRLTYYDMQDPTAPKVAFDMLCSKGTYVRQLVMDVGDDLGCGAYLTRISRTYSQPFHISQALNLETIVTMAKADVLASVVLDPAEIMAEMKKGG